ncbi:MAG: purine-nucleoside phosphorylase [Chitinophagaceae bacterium]|nr:purine-nucleoside phosphorylase [Chitinophagaceae bacterium]
MSIHISAAPGSIAATMLMPGDPLRARLIAEHYLTDAELVSQTRNVYFYTGYYQGHRISVGASGMGCASIGIYSYELYTQYDVQNIIRIGTCGAYTTDRQLYDLINVSLSASESSFARFAWDIDDDALLPAGNAFAALNAVAAANGQQLIAAPVHCSDIFYRKTTDLPAIAAKHACVAVEMEAFALFANAQHLGKTAACLLTVSDVLPTHEKISADQREQSLTPMIELALATAIGL